MKLMLIIISVKVSSNLKNRQEYKKNFILNGALYLSSVKYLKKHKSFITNKTIPYVMQREKSIDIDDITDIKWGEFIQNYKINNE